MHTVCNQLFHLTIYCEHLPRLWMAFRIVFTGFLFCCMTKSWLIYLIAYWRFWLFSSLYSYKWPFTESCINHNFFWNKFLELLGYQTHREGRFCSRVGVGWGSFLECVLPGHCCCLTGSERPWASDHLDSYSEVKSEDKKEITIFKFTT